MLFYGRAAIFLFLGTLILLLAILFMLLMPRWPRIAFLSTRAFCHVGLWVFGIKLEVVGREHLAGTRPRVFISNHQHGVDILILGSLIPMKTVILGKAALLLIPFFGIAYWLAGNIFVNRSNSKKARLSMEKINGAILRDKKSVWIMPEGTRSGRAELLPFKKGAFVTAARTGAPLVCVCVAPYTDRLDLGRWENGKIRVEILEPSYVPRDSAEESMEKTHLKMKEKIGALSG